MERTFLVKIEIDDPSEVTAVEDFLTDILQSEVAGFISVEAWTAPSDLPSSTAQPFPAL